MKTIEGFRLRKLGNEYVLIGESLELINFKKMITLNETAAFLWEKAEELSANRGGFTADELCKALCAEYEVSPEQALSDIDMTLDEWQKAGVVNI